MKEELKREEDADNWRIKRLETVVAEAETAKWKVFDEVIETRMAKRQKTSNDATPSVAQSVAQSVAKSNLVKPIVSNG